MFFWIRIKGLYFLQHTVFIIYRHIHIQNTQWPWFPLGDVDHWTSVNGKVKTWDRNRDLHTSYGKRMPSSLFWQFHGLGSIQMRTTLAWLYIVASIWKQKWWILRGRSNKFKSNQLEVIINILQFCLPQPGFEPRMFHSWVHSFACRLSHITPHNYLFIYLYH